MIKRGDLVQYLDNSKGLSLNKTYEVDKITGHYVYVYSNLNVITFDSMRYFRLATKQEANRYLISKMFNSEV